MIIELRRGTVKLVEHQEGWKEAGTKCIELLSSILGESAVAIEHVGSTAIPGIHAKPIIDIVVGVRSFIRSSSVEKTTPDSFFLSLEMTISERITSTSSPGLEKHGRIT